MILMILVLQQMSFNMYHFLVFLLYQSQVSILGPVGYGPTTLPLRHSDLLER